MANFILIVVLFIACFIIKTFSKNTKLKSFCSYVLGFIFGSIGGGVLYGVCSALINADGLIYWLVPLCTDIGIIIGLAIAFWFEHKKKNGGESSNK